MEHRLDVGEVRRAQHGDEEHRLLALAREGVRTSRPSPLKSMKVFSPARCAWRIVAESGRTAGTDRRTGCTGDRPAAPPCTRAEQHLRDVPPLQLGWIHAQSGSGRFDTGRCSSGKRSRSSATSSSSPGGSGQVSPASAMRPAYSATVLGDTRSFARSPGPTGRPELQPDDLSQLPHR